MCTSLKTLSICEKVLPHACTGLLPAEQAVVSDTQPTWNVVRAACCPAVPQTGTTPGHELVPAITCTCSVIAVPFQFFPLEELVAGFTCIAAIVPSPVLNHETQGSSSMSVGLRKVTDVGHSSPTRACLATAPEAPEPFGAAWRIM